MNSRGPFLKSGENTWQIETINRYAGFVRQCDFHLPFRFMDLQASEPPLSPFQSTPPLSLVFSRAFLWLRNVLQIKTKCQTSSSWDYRLYQPTALVHLHLPQLLAAIQVL